MDNRVFLRVPEVAEMLGLGRSAVYQLLASGELQSVKLSGFRARRVSRRSLEDWIRRQEEQAHGH